MRNRRSNGAWALLAAAGLSGCITVAPVATDEGLSRGPAFEPLPASVREEQRAPPFVGLELAEATLGGLDTLEFMAGLRVMAVAPGSPAEAAGVRVGDRLLSVRDVALERLDQWTALLLTAEPGAEWPAKVERDGGERTVTLRLRERQSEESGATDRFIERRRLRCSATTLTLGEGGGGLVQVARIDALAADSPLRDAGVEAGETIVALDGVPVKGAADLFARVAAMEAGAAVELDVRGGARARRVEVELWEPERHLTSLTLWPLFSWSETPDEMRGELVFVDLWFIWLFKRSHEGEATKSSILRFISWESGVGALTEEDGAGGGP